MKRVTRTRELRQAVADARSAGHRIGFVPTMGALHAGHLSLARAAAERCGFVVASIFVNPLQFAPGEDLESYPRDLAADESALRGLGGAAPELLFAPPVEEVYPRPVVTTVAVDGLTERLCGARRPGHFDGVTTVVAKLFNLVQPDVAFFGRKDFQQLQVVRRATADLSFPVEVVGLPTVREPDGLAMSSRNRYLGGAERRSAAALSRGLAAGVRVAREARAAGRPVPPAAVWAAVSGTLEHESSVEIDYVEVVDPDTLQPPDASGEATGESPETADSEQLLVAVAAFVGSARLIDNVVVGDVADEDALLAAVAAR